MQSNTKSKILFWILAILVIVSLYLTYRRSFITRDFEIYEEEEVLEEEIIDAEITVDEEMGASEGEEI